MNNMYIRPVDIKINPYHIYVKVSKPISFIFLNGIILVVGFIALDWFGPLDFDGIPGILEFFILVIIFYSFFINKENYRIYLDKNLIVCYDSLFSDGIKNYWSDNSFFDYEIVYDQNNSIEVIRIFNIHLDTKEKTYLINFYDTENFGKFKKIFNENFPTFVLK